MADQAKRSGLSRRAILGLGARLLTAGTASTLAGDWTKGTDAFFMEDTSSPPVIDCHAHAGTSGLAGSNDDLTDPWNAVADPHIILRHQIQAGIDRTCVGPIFNNTYEIANEAIAELCRQYPFKFIAFAKHNPKTEAGRIRQLVLREVQQLGIRGLGELHDQPTRELLDVAKELNLPVLYHSKRVSMYEEFLPYYTGVNFIVAHLGSDQSDDWREHVAAIELAKRYPNVHLDTSAVVLSEYIEKAVREVGPEKVIFGSDEVECDSRLEIYKVRVLGLPKEHEKLILGGNMLRLLGGRL